MPRPNAPWYRKSRDAWFVKINGRLRSLGVAGKGNQQKAALAFAKLLAEPAPAQSTASPQPAAVVAPSQVEARSLREVVALALDACKTRTKPATHARYKFDAEAFCDACGDVPAASLAPATVAAWLHARPNGDTTRAIMLRSVSAVLGRAVALGLLTTNPARAVPRPRGRCRAASAVISPDDHAKLLAAATPQLRLVLRLLHVTGARPGEVCAITSENFDAANGVVTLAVHKSDRTGKPRLLFLTPEAVAILVEQRAKFPSGSLLRSRKGVPWRARSITYAMQKLRKRAGVKGAIAYGYRHAFATDALAKGVPDAQVAALLGHTSTAVLHANYSHLTSRARTLREAAAAVRGDGK